MCTQKWKAQLKCKLNVIKYLRLLRHLLNLVWPYDNLFYYHLNPIYWNCWEVEYLNDEGNYYLVRSLFLDYFAESCYCDWKNKFRTAWQKQNHVRSNDLTCYQGWKMVFGITWRRPESLEEWNPVLNFHGTVLCNVQWCLGGGIDLRWH